MKHKLHYALIMCLVASGIYFCPQPIQAQDTTDVLLEALAEPNASDWFTTSSVVYLIGGEDDGKLLLDPGAGRRILDVGAGHFSVVVRAVKIDGRDPDSFSTTLMWVDPLNFADWLDIVIEIGAGNKLVIEGEEGQRDWGLITGIALNWHIASVTAVHFGGRLYQDKPGEISAAGLGGGATLYMDKLLAATLGKLLPK